MMDKCKQCGECCKSEVCFVGQKLYDTMLAPCPGLIYEHEKFWCAAVKYGDSIVDGAGKFLSLALGIETSCDSEIPFSAGGKEVAKFPVAEKR